MLHRSNLLLLTIFCVLTEQLSAQGECLNNGVNLLALQLQYPSEWHVGKDPEIMLVDEDSVPYLNPGITQNDRRIIQGPQMFLRNTPASMKKKHPAQLWQYWPGLPNNIYTITIPERKEQYYLARLLIRHDRTEDTIYFHLPKERSFNICRSGLDTLEQIAAIKQLSESFNIIHIDLSQPLPKPKVSAKPEKFLFKYDVDTGSIGFNGSLLVSLNRIRVYDAATLALAQVIPTPEAWPCLSTELNQMIRPVHLDPNRGSQGIPDLSLVIEEQFDANLNRERKRCLFYRFDPLCNCYIADTSLSAKWDVTIDTKNNILGYEYTSEGNKRILRSFKYAVTSGWIFLTTQTTYDVPQGGYDIPVSKCIQSDIAKSYMGKVHIRSSRWDDDVYVDSMPIYNPCYEKIGVIAEIDARGWMITCPRFLAPQDTTWVKIQHNIHPNYDVQRFEVTGKLIFQDQSAKLITFSYFNVWDSTLMSVTSNSGLAAYVEQPYPGVLSPPITVDMLEVYPDGKPSGYGEVIYGDHQKVGPWESWDSTGAAMPLVRYGKEFRITIMNPTHLSNNLRLFAYQDGKRTELRCIRYNFDFVTWLPDGMDSLRAESGKAYFEGVIELRVLNNEKALYLYLNYPNESFIRQGYNKIPITWDSDSYVLLWDYANPAYSAAGNNAGKLLSARVKTMYPDLMLYMAPEGTDAFFPTIMFTNLSPARKNEILNYLISDPLIDAVSRKVQYGDEMQTFHFNSATIGFDYSINYETAREVANRYGAIMTAVNLAPNLYDFRFPNAILDADWAKKLEALYHEKGVNLVSPSVYAEVVLDDK